MGVAGTDAAIEAADMAPMADGRTSIVIPVRYSFLEGKRRQ